MSIVALDPTSGPVEGTARTRLAPRPPSLSGQRLGLVVNGLGCSERFLDALAAQLLATTELDGVVKVVKSSVSVPPDPGDWSRLTEGATVAITGFGG
ncbi:MAG: hypothetical protein FJW95_08160 [Actinobacteria bacterium]|nr:hypothetical protein [Actinomycetota bacterium]